jgi:hypothetical protein
MRWHHVTGQTIGIVLTHASAHAVTSSEVALVQSTQLKRLNLGGGGGLDGFISQFFFKKGSKYKEKITPGGPLGRPSPQAHFLKNGKKTKIAQKDLISKN